MLQWEMVGWTGRQDWSLLSCSPLLPSPGHFLLPGLVCAGVSTMCGTFPPLSKHLLHCLPHHHACPPLLPHHIYHYFVLVVCLAGRWSLVILLHPFSAPGSCSLLPHRSLPDRRPFHPLFIHPSLLPLPLSIYISGRWASPSPL